MLTNKSVLIRLCFGGEHVLIRHDCRVGNRIFNGQLKRQIDAVFIVVVIVDMEAKAIILVVCTYCISPGLLVPRCQRRVIENYGSKAV